MTVDRWSRDYNIALALVVLVGIALGIAAGYFAYATGASSDGASQFSGWFGSSYRMKERWWWGSFGGLVAAALFFVRDLTSRPSR